MISVNKESKLIFHFVLQFLNKKVFIQAFQFISSSFIFNCVIVLWAGGGTSEKYLVSVAGGDLERNLLTTLVGRNTGCYVFSAARRGLNFVKKEGDETWRKKRYEFTQLQHTIGRNEGYQQWKQNLSSCFQSSISSFRPSQQFTMDSLSKFWISSFYYILYFW